MHGILEPMLSPAVVSLRYSVKTSPEAWVIPEGPVPESTAHDAAVLRVFLLLSAWAARCPDLPGVARNLALRWLEKYPRTGIDPDVCVLSPKPADFDDLTSLRLWEPFRVPPSLCVEIVSSSHPYKDYACIHERYAALGTRELLVFDPLLAGPAVLGGPVALQLWRRDPTDAFERVHFGSEPVHSHVLDAWFLANGRSLKIADDRNGTRLWLTEAEQAKAQAEQAEAQAEQAKAKAEQAKAKAETERAARELLELRVRQLEAARES